MQLLEYQELILAKYTIPGKASPGQFCPAHDELVKSKEYIYIYSPQKLQTSILVMLLFCFHEPGQWVMHLPAASLLSFSQVLLVLLLARNQTCLAVLQQQHLHQTLTTTEREVTQRERERQEDCNLTAQS